MSKNFWSSVFFIQGNRELLLLSFMNIVRFYVKLFFIHFPGNIERKEMHIVVSSLL